MIIPDVNLLVYVYDVESPFHPGAKRWWEGLLNGRGPVAIPWAVVLGFIRLMTHPQVMHKPLRPEQAIETVRVWFTRPQVGVLTPGPRHLDLLANLFADLGVAASLTTDAHLAALAIEHQAELHSNDADFGRFAGLRWRNPLR